MSRVIGAADTAAPFPILETPRLVLRALRDTDAPSLYEAFRDPAVMAYWSTPPHTDVAITAAMIAHIVEAVDKRRCFEWAVTLRDSGGVSDLAIGKVCHHRWIREHFRSEIGYLLRRDAWGHGYMTEALRAILDFGWTRMGLHSVEAQIDPRNAASIRAALRLGFTREALFRENYFFEGQFLDTAVYSLLRP